MNQWLVRTADNWIKGPFSEDQIRKMVTSGELALNDEICRANHYWIYLYEKEEVQEQLGVVPPQPSQKDPDEETTDTETEPALTQKANPEPIRRMQSPTRNIPKLRKPREIEGISIWRAITGFLIGVAILLVLTAVWILRS